MKKTLAEQFRAQRKHLCRKNKILGFLMTPVFAVILFFYSVGNYFGGNRKRFAMMAMSLFLFTVYSSFSFPAFITGGQSEESFFDFEVQDEGITLAREEVPDLKNIQLLSEEELTESQLYEEFSLNYVEMDTYDADEILAARTREDASQEDGGQDGNMSGDNISENGEQESDTENTDGSEPVFSRDDWRLILVNKQHSIPEDYQVSLAVIGSNTDRRNMQCDERIIDDLLDMLQAAQDDGITLSICSSYRDKAYQEFLFDRHMKDYMGRGMSYMEAFKLSSQAVNVPEFSEHQIGLALDIVCDTYTELNEGYADTDAGKWLAENCYNYGFILRYPKGKEHITCIQYEPWHFRYVGVEAATKITKEGITLEEFWEDL